VFGRTAKIRKAVPQAQARIASDDDLADHVPIEALADELKPPAYFQLAEVLHCDERNAAARQTLERAIELAPAELQVLELAAAVDRGVATARGAIRAVRGYGLSACAFVFCRSRALSRWCWSTGFRSLRNETRSPA
jgi:hypothetical protein